MWTWLFNTVLPLLGTFAVGAFGWWVTHFIASPILRFYRLREEARESIFFTANVSTRLESDPKPYDDAVSELRRVAARLEALARTSSWLTRRFFVSFRYDPYKAALAITGLSNMLWTKDGTKTLMRHQAEVALRLPLEDTPERIARIRKRQEQGDFDRL